jgi:hypothetical protein
MQQVDYLRERLGPFDNDDALELFRQGLNAIFALESSAPAMTFHAVFVHETGKLAAVVEPRHWQSNLPRWCREVEVYFGGRLQVQPEVSDELAAKVL